MKLKRDHPKPGMRVLHARYGQGNIRTIVSNYLEIDFDDGKRRYLKNSGFIKLNPKKGEGADENLTNFPESYISKKEIEMVREAKTRKKIKEVVDEKTKAKQTPEMSTLTIAKAAIRDELKTKGDRELRSLCASHGINYNKYAHLKSGLKRMNVINTLSSHIAKATI